MQEDLEVTGVSRSGRVRKKSSKLMDFESPDDIETRYRRTQAAVKHYAPTQFRVEDNHEYRESPPQRVAEDPGAASGSESDYYDNNGENNERWDMALLTESAFGNTGNNHSMTNISIESDSSVSDEDTPRQGPGGIATSLYMMEKSSKKKLIVKDGRVVGRAKAQRKDKGKTRITAYMMWAKEARHDLLRKHPDMDFSAISKRLGEMWANVNYNERYLWKRKAKRFAIQKEQSNHQGGVGKIISNQIATRPLGHAGPGRPRKVQPPLAPAHPPPTPPSASASSGGVYRAGGCGAAEVAAHLKLLGESLAIIGERLKEHEGQIAVSGSVSVLLDTLLCSLAPLLGVARAIPAIAPPASLLQDTLHNIAYIMPGL